MNTNQIDFKRTQFIYQKKAEKLVNHFILSEFENIEEKIEIESWDSFQAFS